MSKLTKNQKSVADKVEVGKAYSLKEASELGQGDHNDQV
jgi:large subunit ribosomal protein L1